MFGQTDSAKMRESTQATRGTVAPLQQLFSRRFMDNMWVGLTEARSPRELHQSPQRRSLRTKTWLDSKIGSGRPQARLLSVARGVGEVEGLE